jgi:hypothetical protein
VPSAAAVIDVGKGDGGRIVVDRGDDFVGFDRLQPQVRPQLREPCAT